MFSDLVIPPNALSNSEVRILAHHPKTPKTAFRLRGFEAPPISPSCLPAGRRLNTAAVARIARRAMRATLRGYVLPACGRSEHTPRQARYVLPACGRSEHTRAFFWQMQSFECSLRR